MLGCQDFCGYYDWSFGYVRKHKDIDAVHKLWADISIAQQHYTDAGMTDGLRGLYDTWCGTAVDEHFDWSFTLDEAGNTLRWDMKQCPSKGFLIDNDLHSDEDYCDHCMGWIIPVADQIGAEVVAHEHNHAGQCWGHLRMKGQPSKAFEGHADDITADPLWQRGHIDRWENDVKLPVIPEASPANDAVDVIRHWFADVKAITVLGQGPGATDHWTAQHTTDSVIVTDATYATKDVYADSPCAIVIGDQSQVLAEVSERFHATPPDQRPLLMHTYLPGEAMLPFAQYNLPRPVPLLPILLREQLYEHIPHTPHPTAILFALLLAAALNKPTIAAGLDWQEHLHDNTPAHKKHSVDSASPTTPPSTHSQACERLHIQRATARLRDRLQIHP